MLSLFTATANYHMAAPQPQNRQRLPQIWIKSIREAILPLEILYFSLTHFRSLRLKELLVYLHLYLSTFKVPVSLSQLLYVPCASHNLLDQRCIYHMYLIFSTISLLMVHSPLFFQWLPSILQHASWAVLFYQSVI